MGSNGAASGIDPYNGRGGISTVYGTEFTTLLQDGNVKFVRVANPEESSRIPQETRTQGRVYAVVSHKGDLTSVATYDAHGKRKTQIEWHHAHGNLKPHVHDYNDHVTARRETAQETALRQRLERRWKQFKAKGGKP